MKHTVRCYQTVRKLTAKESMANAGAKNTRMMREYHECFLPRMEWGGSFFDPIGQRHRMGLEKVKMASEKGDVIIVPELVHLAPNWRLLVELVEWLCFHKIGLHVVEPRLRFPEPETKRTFEAMKAAVMMDLACKERILAERLRKRQQYGWVGPIPWGYKVGKVKQRKKSPTDMLGKKQQPKLLIYDRELIAKGVYVTKALLSGDSYPEVGRRLGLARITIIRIQQYHIKFSEKFAEMKPFVMDEEKGVTLEELTTVTAPLSDKAAESSSAPG